MKHIAEAEKHVAKLHAEQIAWAQSSPEAENHLKAARMRAVIRVAVRDMGASHEELWDLRHFMRENWNLGLERTLMSQDCVVLDDLIDGMEVDYTDDGNNLFDVLVNHMWPDVVVETDEWARRHAPQRSLHPVN